MAIDPEKAVGAIVGGGPTHWSEDDVILYHLGIGAGVPPTDERELRYVYEESLHVLPTYAVVAGFAGVGWVTDVDGVDIDPAAVLHGEHDLRIAKPVPTAAKASNAARIAAVHDKGKAALVVFETETTDDEGDLLFANRMSLFVRGEGGFGGDGGPKSGNLPPERAPDLVVESPTLPQQALLYRLSGDKNPLHADPVFAARAGFDRPVLHGLCTYGVVCKAVVDNVLGGDVTRVARYQARFASVVFPGETIVTSMWQEGEQVFLQASAKERGTAALTNACITLR